MIGFYGFVRTLGSRRLLLRAPSGRVRGLEFGGERSWSRVSCAVLIPHRRVPRLLGSEGLGLWAWGLGVEVWGLEFRVVSVWRRVEGRGVGVVGYRGFEFGV